MKQDTVHSLLAAKILLDEARSLISSSNQYACSAGLIFLQDALEIVFLASLRELGVDQTKNIESFTFDQLIGELVAHEVKVPKSGTLKALNKQRVIVKHYGQVADPVSTLSYLNSANESTSAILRQVVGKEINDIFLTDLLPDGHQAKAHLTDASRLIDEGHYYEALIETRKAYFVEIEAEYCIYMWRDVSSATPHYWMRIGMRGTKAPWHTRNQEWIAQHVHQPSDYIQIDADRFRMDAVEWGVNTADLHNISQLTPQAFQLEPQGAWHTRAVNGFKENMATLQNARYCLDRMIAVTYKKHIHQSARRWTPYGLPAPPRPVYIGHPVFARPDTTSNVIHSVQEGFTYSVNYQTTGFDPTVNFLNVSVHPPRAPDASLLDGPFPFSGFVIDHGP